MVLRSMEMMKVISPGAIATTPMPTEKIKDPSSMPARLPERSAMGARKGLRMLAKVANPKAKEMVFTETFMPFAKMGRKGYTIRWAVCKISLIKVNRATKRGVWEFVVLFICSKNTPPFGGRGAIFALKDQSMVL
jgi:hypothetical protein